MTMITPSYLGETIEYSSLHACRSTLEDPTIAGKGIANPIGAIWAGALMLSHFGHQDLHDRIVSGIERVVSGGKVRTPDLGGKATTAEMMKAVAGEI